MSAARQSVYSMFGSGPGSISSGEGSDDETSPRRGSPKQDLPRQMTGGRRRAYFSQSGGLEELESFNAKAKQSRQYRVRARFIHCCRRLVDNNLLVGLTTLMTLWVLICDDVRILTTQRTADNYFEAILIFCLVIFSMEILLTCVGKDDYFMGFFFILDVVSTGSLVLDLPSVQESMASEEQNISSQSEGKTARIGAKAARVVRIVRLVRIVKLYKIIVTHFENRIDDWLGIKSDEDSHFLEMVDSEQDDKQKESRVGKQLSHATLKRVIVLILAMLVVVPSLSASEGLKYPLSPSYGADEVSETFVAMQHGAVERLFYEQTMLRYIYYHNWFAGNGECPAGKMGSCPNVYYNHLFWVGVAGTDFDTVNAKVSAAKIRASTVTQWEHNTSRRNGLYNTGGMPPEAQSAISSDWDVRWWTKRSDGIREFTRGFSLLSDSAGGKVSYTATYPKDLRAAEIDRYFPRLIDENSAELSHFVFYYDMRMYLREEASFGITVTVYVCFSLVIAIMFFSRDANQLVLAPVESMIAKVEKIRENPLAAVKMGDEEFRQEEQDRIKKQRQLQRLGVGCLGSCLGYLDKITKCKFTHGKHQPPMETLILEKTLVKLGSLLALGFGEAGANIINKNMAAAETADVNVMIQGERIQCVYGQAKIQDFSVVTEVLQSKVMQFVNQIAEIVHGVVVEFLGAANKNTGDTFLLVWRCTSDCMSDPYRLSDQLCKLADMSVAAFCKILASLQQSPALAAYRGHPRIQFLLGADYKVHLNIGLHAGWAFEGAMGSEYKIDASYISPNIAITGKVEQATLHFRVALLITEEVISLCSPGVQDVCRLIDSIYIAGHKDPMELYCVDVDMSALYVDRTHPDMHWNPRTRYKVRQFLETEKMRNWAYEEFEDGLCYQTLYKDDSFQAMREKFSMAFVQTFRMGFNNYKEGEWEEAAKLLFSACQVLRRRDGPSESLLAFMQERSYKAPHDWQGSRDIEPLLVGPPRDPPRPERLEGDPVSPGQHGRSDDSLKDHPKSTPWKTPWKKAFCDDEVTNFPNDNFPGLQLPNEVPREKDEDIRALGMRKDNADTPNTGTSKEESV